MEDYELLVCFVNKLIIAKSKMIVNTFWNYLSYLKLAGQYYAHETMHFICFLRFQGHKSEPLSIFLSDWLQNPGELDRFDIDRAQ